MLRITKFVGKQDLFTLMLHPDVAKVELMNTENKTLTNPDICRVQIYLRIPKNDIPSLVGNLKTLKETRNIDWAEGVGSFITGLCSISNTNFVKWSHIIKLKVIEHKLGVDFSIPKRYDALVAKFDHLKNA